MQIEHNRTILVFRIPNTLDPEDIEAIKNELQKQLESGIIVHDNKCELVAVISKDNTDTHFKKGDGRSPYYPPTPQSAGATKWILSSVISLISIMMLGITAILIRVFA